MAIKFNLNLKGKYVLIASNQSTTTQSSQEQTLLTEKNQEDAMTSSPALHILQLVKALLEEESIVTILSQSLVSVSHQTQGYQHFSEYQNSVGSDSSISPLSELDDLKVSDDTESAHEIASKTSDAVNVADTGNLANSEEAYAVFELRQMASRGEIGLVERKYTESDCFNYHWIITTSYDAEITNYCKYSRTLVSILNEPESSDIKIEGLMATSSQKQLYVKTQVHSRTSSISNISDLTLSDHATNQICYTDSKTIVKDRKLEPVAKAKPSVELESDIMLSQIPLAVRPQKKTSILYLIGVGPGSPDLQTIRANNLLHTLPLLITDRLISPSLFSTIPSTTRVLFTRKVCGSASKAQDEIGDWILEGLARGDVGRVKGGDPFVFGRGGEEWELARRHGYKVVWVPGVSSCISAAGAAGIPVTHRGVADSFVVSTGVRRDGSLGGVPDYSPTRTVVILMAVGVLDKVCLKLEELGYPRETRIAVVHRATFEDMIVVRGSVGDVAKLVFEAGVRSWATVIVGAVVDCLSRDE